MCEMALLMPEKTLEKYDPIEGAAKIAKLNDEQMRKLNRAIELWELEQKGRLLVLPCNAYAELVRDGETYRADHWNHTLTAFCDDPTTRSGKRVALFSVEEAAAALKGAEEM